MRRLCLVTMVAIVTALVAIVTALVAMVEGILRVQLLCKSLKWADGREMISFFARIFFSENNIINAEHFPQISRYFL